MPSQKASSFADDLAAVERGSFAADLADVAPTFQSSNEKDAAGNAVVDPNTLWTFARHVGEQINPVTAVQSVAQAVRHPLDALHAVGTAQGALFDKAKASYQAGDYVTAARHFVDYLLPLVGPALDRSADAMQQGHVAAGAGDAVGLGLALFGPQAIAKAKISVPKSAALADAADAAANRRVVNVMVPQVGPNKVRFGNMADSVAGDVARETTAMTRPGLLDQAGTKLDTAHDALNAAYDAVPNTRMYQTGPILSDLQAAVKRLSVSGVGGSVEPATRASQIASLKQAIQEVRGLGPMANLDNLRNLRIAWDAGAKAVFTPAVAADYLAARGAGSGWADARSVLADYLAAQHPELKPLNADVHLWTKAVDVMQAAEEADRVRPTVGRSIMARGLGAAAGAAEGGGLGAIVGAVVAPTLERGMAALAPAQKMFVARQLTALADALRAGQIPKATDLLTSVSRVLGSSAVVKSSQTVTPWAAPLAAQGSAPSQP